MRASVATAVGLFAGIAAFSMAAGLLGSWSAALIVGLVVAAAVSWWSWSHPFIALDATAVSRGLLAVSGLTTIVALVLLGRLAVFMVDPTRTSYSNVPNSAWEVRHLCLTAYYVAAQAVDQGRDPFDPKLYNAPEDDGTGLRRGRKLGPFNVDVYEYPPPFLLLPRAVMAATPDFMRLRSLWFGLNLAALAAALLVVARRLGPVAGTRALLLAPLVLASLPTLSLLQKGNIQGAVIAMSMVAMVLFEQKRGAAGGALLAYATVSKLFRGLLIVYLLVRRQWHALAWTAAFAFAYVAATFAYAGTAPFVGFVHHLPGLLGGEAFMAFRNPMGIASNYSVPGLAFKARLFGVPGMGFAAAKVIGWIWTALVLWLIVRVARRMLCAEREPLVWLAVLILATLRSPFLPQGYGAGPSLWQLTLLAALAAPTARTLALTLLGWVALNLLWPSDWPFDPRVVALVNGVSQALIIALAWWTLWRAPAPARPALPAAAPARSPAA